MILASQSQRRQQLLKEAGFDFRCIVSDVDETALSCSDPRKLSAVLAYAKAQAVSGRALPHELVIGADTTVIVEVRILNKPQDERDACRMLELLSDKTHEVITAVCIFRDNACVCSFDEVARVTFWDLSPVEIERYVATKEPLDKAGAYGIQGAGRLLVRRIDGDFYTVVGLPISRLVRELKALGEEPSLQIA